MMDYRLSSTLSAVFIELVVWPAKLVRNTPPTTIARISATPYSTIIQNEHKFDYILTYDKNLLERSDKYIKYVVGQSRISEPKIYEKSKMVSMIASNKKITEGHRYRHTIANSLSSKHNIDMWGSGYRRFDNKLEPLKDYYFSIQL